MGLLTDVALGTLFAVLERLLQKDEKQRIWQDALHRIKDSTPPAEYLMLCGLEGVALDEDELRRHVKITLENNKTSEDAAGPYAEHLADKLLKALQSAADDYYTSDPLTKYHPFQRLFGELKRELDAQGEDVRQLVIVAQAFSVEFWPQIRSQLRRLPSASLIWQPLEEYLQRDRVTAFDPQVLRPRGPSWWDFEDRRVFLRSEVDEIVAKLSENTQGGVYLLDGAMAAGKSVIASHVGFKWCPSAPVFYVNAGDASFQQSTGPEIAEGTEVIAERFTGQEGYPPLFIVDDLHRNRQTAEALVESLTRMHQPRAHFLLVTRPLGAGGGSNGSALFEQVDLTVRLGSDAFDTVASDMARFLWSQKTGEALSDGEAYRFARTASPSMWVLAWLVAGYSGDGVIDRTIAHREARSHMGSFRERGFTATQRVADILLCLAPFSRLEMSIDAQFVARELDDTPEVEETLARLAELGEVSTSLRDEDGVVGVHYSLPHSALADLYLEADVSAGPGWPPDKRMRDRLGEEWATELVMRRLADGDGQLLIAMMKSMTFHPEAATELLTHPGADAALLAASAELLQVGAASCDRSWAAQGLALTDSPQAITLLARLLRAEEESDDVRRSAAYGLAGFGHAAVQPLVDALDDEEWRVRGWAAFSLGKIGSCRAVPALADRLLDETEDEHVHWAAAHALGDIGDRKALDPLLHALRQGDMNLRAVAAGALGKLGCQSAASALAAKLQNEDENQHVRSSAAYALGDLRATSCLDLLISSLRDPERSVRWSAAVALKKIGDASSGEALREALSDEDTGVAGIAAMALGELRIVAAVEDLCIAVQSDNRPLAGMAAGALGKLGGETAVTALLEAFSNRQVPRAVARALGETGDGRATPVLIGALGDEDDLVSAAAAEALGNIRDPGAVPALIDVLRSAPYFGRAAAAWSLGQIGKPEAIPGLIRQLRNEDRFQSVLVADWQMTLLDATVMALIAMGDQAVEPVIEVMGDEDRVVRRSAAAILGYIASPEAVPALELATTDHDPGVRAQAQAALQRIPRTPNSGGR